MTTAEIGYTHHTGATVRTVPEAFQQTATLRPNQVALRTVGGTQQITWADYARRVRAIAAGLAKLGVAHGDTVGIMLTNRPEFNLVDTAILHLGATPFSVYNTSSPEQIAHVFGNAENGVVVTEQAFLAPITASGVKLEHVIVVDGAAPEGGLTLDQVENDPAEDFDFDAAWQAVRPDDLATLIYTSGTTGTPKGVELPHDCWLYEAEAIDALNLLTPEDQQYLWLPLAHAFGKVLEAAQLRIGFPTAIDGRIERMVANLAVIRPTFVCGVPRIFEKVHNKVVASGKEGGGLKAKIFEWALGVGFKVSALQLANRPVPATLAAQRAVAQKLVFSKIQGRFGGRLRFFFSGASALSKEVASFFHAAGILILEGYGLTETSAGTVISSPDKFRLGAVGIPVKGTQAKLAPEDGEILLKGRGVMRGYHHLPEATAEVFTADGWFRTGDIGEIDSDGFVKITDRKKDLIKTSGGKYVAPQYLEGKMKAVCPYVSQVVIHGDNRKFISALMTLDEEAIRPWAAENGLTGKSYAEISADPRAKKLIQGYVDQVNKELPSYETIKHFALLPADLSIEAGELTPSMKVKRKVVEKKYKAVLDGLYASGKQAEA